MAHRTGEIKQTVEKQARENRETGRRETESKREKERGETEREREREREREWMADPMGERRQTKET